MDNAVTLESSRQEHQSLGVDGKSLSEIGSAQTPPDDVVRNVVYDLGLSQTRQFADRDAFLNWVYVERTTALFPC